MVRRQPLAGLTLAAGWDYCMACTLIIYKPGSFTTTAGWTEIPFQFDFSEPEGLYLWFTNFDQCFFCVLYQITTTSLCLCSDYIMDVLIIL